MTEYDEEDNYSGYTPEYLQTLAQHTGYEFALYSEHEQVIDEIEKRCRLLQEHLRAVEAPDGMTDDILSLKAGESVLVRTGTFTNDMETFHSEDDVLTLLIHLGYLGYDFSNKCVFIPNNEIRTEFGRIRGEYFTCRDKLRYAE